MTFKSHASARFVAAILLGFAGHAGADPFAASDTFHAPVANLELTGGAVRRFLGDSRKDFGGDGIGLSSSKPSGAVSFTVSNLDYAHGKWFRFGFRGLPEANFAVLSNDLYMKIEYFGQDGKISYDAKEKRIYDQVQTLRRDLTVNGDHHQHGAEVWRNYVVDFCLPFPQVAQLRLTVGFGHGAARQTREADFLVDALGLTRIPEPAGAPTPAARPAAIVPAGKLIPLGGRWFYDAKDGETAMPAAFDSANADRLIYHDNIYSAPFAGNTSAWLRAGDVGADGQVAAKDRFLADNVTIRFASGEMIIHTHGVPNHPTGRFPELGFGNPNYITERLRTYYFPLEPAENPQHFVTDADNANGALPMGPIGLAVNGVVFFNPFDMNSQDASDMMDRCCGHPAPDGQYHYHKYPICVNSPWADDGGAHSPLLGWAFDGYPLYGPYESAGVMAKDAQGEHALNDFNMHYDKERGWHYHVTPGKFPYLIGGYWGTKDAKDRGGPGPGGPRGPGGRFGGPPGPGNRPGGPPPGGPRGLGGFPGGPPPGP